MPWKINKSGEEEFYFDELEIKIIKKFYGLGSCDKSKNWIIMTELFNPKADYLKRNFYKKLQSRIEGMAKLGIFKISETKTKIFYDLLEENVIFKKIKIRDKLVECIGVFACEKWHLFQL